MDETSLLADLASPDASQRRAAFRLVFQSHGPELRGFLLRSGAGPEADDLLQETFLRAYRALATRPPTTLRAWLFGIARNLLIDHARRRERQGKVFRLLPPATEVAPSEDPEQEARVQAGLADLEPSERLLLLQRYGAATPLRELAAAGDCTERTVRNRLQRALEHLTQALLRSTGASS
jgi:RNA polymerase sigma-70 factor, ECF subfamily